MTPEEVFARLRDIHVPETGGASLPVLDPWPLAVFGVLALSGWLIRQWIKSRRITKSLAAIDRALPPDEQRDRIVRLVRGRKARALGPKPPRAAFLPPSQLTPDQVEDLRRWAMAKVR